MSLARPSAQALWLRATKREWLVVSIKADVKGRRVVIQRAKGHMHRSLHACVRKAHFQVHHEKYPPILLRYVFCRIEKMNCPFFLLLIVWITDECVWCATCACTDMYYLYHTLCSNHLVTTSLPFAWEEAFRGLIWFLVFNYCWGLRENLGLGELKSPPMLIALVNLQLCGGDPLLWMHLRECMVA